MIKKFLLMIIFVGYQCLAMKNSTEVLWKAEVERLKKILNNSDAELNYISKDYLGIGDFDKIDSETQKQVFWGLPQFKRAKTLAEQKFHKSLLELDNTQTLGIKQDAFFLWGVDEDRRGDNSKEPESRELNQRIRSSFTKIISDIDANSVVLFVIGCYIGVYNRSINEIATWPTDATLQQLPPYFSLAASKYKKNRFKIFLIDPSFGSEFDTDMPLSLRSSKRVWKTTLEETSFVRCYNNENIDIYVIPLYVNLWSDVNLILDAAEKIVSKNGVALVVNFAFPTLNSTFSANIKSRKFDSNKFIYWYFFDDLHKNQYPQINLLSLDDKEIVIGDENDMLKSDLMLLKKSLNALKSKLNEVGNKLGILKKRLAS